MIEEESSKFEVRGVHVSKRLLWGALLTGLIIFPIATMYTILSDYMLIVAIHIFVFTIAVLSYDLLFGYTGLLSFGHALFFGGGTYGIILLITELGLSYTVAFPIVLVIVTLLALIVGAISLRVSGVYFAIVTLAFAQVGYQIVVQFRDITGGRDGISAFNTMPEIAGIDFGNVYPAYAVTLLVLILVYVFLRRLVNSQFGRILQGIRENEERMRMLGVNTYRYKLIAFAISGALASVAGMVYLFYASYVDVSLMNWETTGDMIMMGLIGGFGTLWGGVLGAAAYILFEEVLSGFLTEWKIVFGAAFVIFVLFMPTGLAGLVEGDSNNTVWTWIKNHMSDVNDSRGEDDD